MVLEWMGEGFKESQEPNRCGRQSSWSSSRGPGGGGKDTDRVLLHAEGENNRCVVFSPSSEVMDAYPSILSRILFFRVEFLYKMYKKN